MEPEQNTQNTGGDQKKSILTIILLIIVLALAFFGYQAFNNKEIAEEDTAEELQNQEGASELFSEEVSNPLEGTSNPYEDIKTNPFE